MQSSDLTGNTKPSDIILCLALILLSGNPTVQFVLGKNIYLIAPPLFLLIYATLRDTRLKENDGLVILLFAGIAVTHIISFGTSVLPASLGFLLKLLTALLVVRIVENFAEIYVRIMYGLSILSFVFYFPVIAGVDLQNFLAPFNFPIDDGFVHIGLHNFAFSVHALRNSGMFWEPGAFAGYLVLAILFVISMGINKKVDKKVIVVLLIALLTTQSTTGYIALFVCLILYAVITSGTRISAQFIFMIIITGVAGVLAFQTLPFLGEKFIHQLEMTTIGSEGAEINRFGNMLYDLESIRQRPIFGWSHQPEARAVVDQYIDETVAGQGNGLTGFATKVGLFGLLCYLYFVYKTFYRLFCTKLAAITAVIVVTALLNGEQYLNFPVFLALLFLREEDKLTDISSEIHKGFTQSIEA